MDVGQVKSRSKDSLAIVGVGTIRYSLNCSMSSFIGRLECSIRIDIVTGGFTYSIENMIHKSIDGTFDFGPLTSAIPFPLTNYPSINPLAIKCWTRVKKNALEYCDKIGKEITEQITTGSITPSE